jgi:hypothetical protein
VTSPLCCLRIIFELNHQLTVVAKKLHCSTLGYPFIRHIFFIRIMNNFGLLFEYLFYLIND